MSDTVVIQHDDRIYKVAVDALAQYEVTDDGAKNALIASRDDAAAIDTDDEVTGFAAVGGAMLRGTSAWRFKPGKDLGGGP
jgi:hypothetical protein